MKDKPTIKELILVTVLFGFLIVKIFDATDAISKQENQPVLSHPFVQVPIVVYHSFGPQIAFPESWMQRHYRIDTENFDAQMQFLQDAGYTPITFNTLAQYYMNNASLPKKPIVLTFDDGWNSQYKYAVPILEKYNFTGTFFIITNYTTDSYMNWDMIRDLDSKGFEIASHSENHPMLTRVSEDQLHQEIFDSKQKLERKLGHAISTMAYPDYATDERVQTTVKDAGYIAGRGGWKKDKNSKETLFDMRSQEAVNNPDPFSDILMK